MPKKHTAKFSPTEITLKEVPDSDLMELVDACLEFSDSEGKSWVALEGARTDGASVPQYALWFTDGRFGRGFLKAAVVHDAYCQKENEGRYPYGKKPLDEVHRMFYEACLAGKTSRLKAKTMFYAVSYFGPSLTHPASEEGARRADALVDGFGGRPKWIEENDPSVKEMEEDIEKRQRMLLEVRDLQYEGTRALGRRKPKDAEEKFLQAQALLEKAADEFSGDDLMVLNLRGYLYKNWAQLYKRLGEHENAEQSTDGAAKVFQRVLKSEPRDASALNGLGNVWYLRGDLDRAERYIRRALAICPDYPAAIHDLGVIEAAWACRIGKRIGATRVERTSSEFLMGSERVVIKRARRAASSVEVDLTVLPTVTRVIGALQRDDGSFELRSLTAVEFEKAMWPSGGRGGSGVEVGRVARSTFQADGELIRELVL